MDDIDRTNRLARLAVRAERARRWREPTIEDMSPLEINIEVTYGDASVRPFRPDADIGRTKAAVVEARRIGRPIHFNVTYDRNRVTRREMR